MASIMNCKPTDTHFKDKSIIIDLAHMISPCHQMQFDVVCFSGEAGNLAVVFDACNWHLLLASVRKD